VGIGLYAVISVIMLRDAQHDSRYLGSQHALQNEKVTCLYFMLLFLYVTIFFFLPEIILVERLVDNSY